MGENRRISLSSEALIGGTNNHHLWICTPLKVVQLLALRLEGRQKKTLSFYLAVSPALDEACLKPRPFKTVQNLKLITLGCTDSWAVQTDFLEPKDKLCRQIQKMKEKEVVSNSKQISQVKEGLTAD